MRRCAFLFFGLTAWLRQMKSPTVEELSRLEADELRRLADTKLQDAAAMEI